MAFPEQRILDTCVRADENPLNPAFWAGKIDSDDGNMRIVSNQMASAGAGTFNSALWPTRFNQNMEVFVDYDTLSNGGHSLELWTNIQNGGTPTPSGYVLRFWHSTGGGVGTFELDRCDAGVLTRLFDEGVTISAGDQIGLWNNGGILRVYVNGVEKPNFAEPDSTYKDGQIGIQTENDGGVQVIRLSNFGGGAVPVVSPDIRRFPEYILAGDRPV